MRLLLDTHVFLWYLAGSPRLTPSAAGIIAGAEEVYVSAASIWEIAIKVAAGKLSADVVELAAQVVSNGFIELPVSARHAVVVAGLPPHHGDPFDRLLIAQALDEPLTLVTHDRALQQYRAPIQWV